ncbi:MAG TPA: protoporphyrinogen oxidase [Opitutaceae bacterium]|nr:protoporphyrinogen oxidase [Opitutaceae bacterium]
MTATGPGKSIAVLGGGITGLTAAYRLSQRGHRVRLFEQSGRLGGAIRTKMSDGWLAEAGPNTLQETPGIVALIRELGLESERVEAGAAAKNRFVVRDGKLIPLPLSPGALLASPLFSLRAKLRALTEIATSPRTRATDCSVADFARSHFGAELLDYAVQPFVSGIYAGDAEKLSLRHAFPKLWAAEQSHGSIIRGQIAAAKVRRAGGESAIPKIISFRRGLQALPDALTARLPANTVVLSARVERLIPGRSWQVMWRDAFAAEPRTENFDAVVVALPASSLASLAIGAGANEEPLRPLESIPHPPVSALFLGFRKEDVSHALGGFGALVPAREKRALLGVLFSSTLFPGRAPEGHVGLTVLAGGTFRPEIPRESPDEVLEAVRDDLRDLLGIKGAPVFLRHTFWPRAIPQYHLGYERPLQVIADCEQAHAGLFIGGQVRDGISLPNCLASGENLARRAVT